MALYTPENLCILSTILTCATRSQSWGRLGKHQRNTQEEIQMMCVGDQLFIACNTSGHLFVQEFMKAFAVKDNDSLLDALKKSHYLIGASHDERSRWYNTNKHTQYSGQELLTLEMFKFPKKLPKKSGIIDKGFIFSRVGKPERSILKKQNTNSWETGVFQQMLGVYSNSNGYVSEYNSPPPHHFKTVKIDGSIKDTDKLILIKDISKTHAELKLLSLLAKMVIDGKILSGSRVHLGGSKGACKRCHSWITTYKQWLKDHHDIKLILPKKDTRPSATPVVWEKPLSSVKNVGSVNQNIALLFK